jgi:hypothetical protein
LMVRVFLDPLFEIMIPKIHLLSITCLLSIK